MRKKQTSLPSIQMYYHKNQKSPRGNVTHIPCLPACLALLERVTIFGRNCHHMSPLLIGTLTGIKPACRANPPRFTPSIARRNGTDLTIMHLATFLPFSLEVSNHNTTIADRFLSMNTPTALVTSIAFCQSLCMHLYFE